MTVCDNVGQDVRALIGKQQKMIFYKFEYFIKSTIL